MSAGLFSKALKGAGFSVTTSKEGMRSFRSEHDDRTSDPPRGGKAPRGSWRGGRGNWRGSSRGRRGGRSRGGQRDRGRGQRYQYSSGGSQEEFDDDDEDVDMDDSGSDRSSYKRYTPYGARPSYRQSGNKFQSSKSQNYQSDETWNKISVPNGRKHDKEWLLKRLQNSSEVSFQPVEFHYSQEYAHFFVNDQRSANALRALSGTITVKDGSKLFIQVRRCPPPKITSSASIDTHSGTIDQDVLKLCLNTRYDPTTNSLDLSNFYHDKVLSENQIQGVISRPWLMTMIIQLIKEFCPQLQNLDLRNNRISSLDPLKELYEAAPSISSLHLGENNLRHINELRKIKNMKELKSLVTDGNPLCDNYSNSQTGYVSDIRSIFPKLVTLTQARKAALAKKREDVAGRSPVVTPRRPLTESDSNTERFNTPTEFKIRSSQIGKNSSEEGQKICTSSDLKENVMKASFVVNTESPSVKDNCELPAHIGFDLPTSTSLPETKGSFIPDDLTGKLVLPFVKQYFEVYDSDNRQKLLDAYDDEAVFSMCVADHRVERGNGSGPLKVYRKYSRNMKFLHDSDRRLELLKTSRLSVVAFLNDLPTTKHDLGSLTVDINFVQTACLGFTVCGVFKEGDSQELRAFTRAFIAVPAQRNSIAIINDQLTIRNPSQAERELSNKSSGFGAAAVGQTVQGLFPAAVVPVPATPATTPTPTSASSLGVQQQQMVDQFSKQSGMNISWSFKALAENNWDYQKAAEMFKSLHAKGSIPQEAFVK